MFTSKQDSDLRIIRQLWTCFTFCILDTTVSTILYQLLNNSLMSTVTCPVQCRPVSTSKAADNIVYIVDHTNKSIQTNMPIYIKSVHYCITSAASNIPHRSAVGLGLKPSKAVCTTAQRGTKGQSNLTKSASRGDHSPVRGHPTHSLTHCCA